MYKKFSKLPETYIVSEGVYNRIQQRSLKFLKLHNNL